jgi:hypothetical protein
MMTMRFLRRLFDSRPSPVPEASPPLPVSPPAADHNRSRRIALLDFSGVTFSRASTDTTPLHGPGWVPARLVPSASRILDALDPAWSARRRTEPLAILVGHPFTDGGLQIID